MRTPSMLEHVAVPDVDDVELVLEDGEELGHSTVEVLGGDVRVLVEIRGTDAIDVAVGGVGRSTSGHLVVEVGPLQVRCGEGCEDGGRAEVSNHRLDVPLLLCPEWPSSRDDCCLARHSIRDRLEGLLEELSKCLDTELAVLLVDAAVEVGDRLGLLALEAVEEPVSKARIPSESTVLGAEEV
jgi:hypothetical protein